MERHEYHQCQAHRRHHWNDARRRQRHHRRHQRRHRHHAPTETENGWKIFNLPINAPIEPPSRGTWRMAFFDRNFRFFAPPPPRGFDWLYAYILSYRECGQFRPCLHEHFEKFEIISTLTGSWNYLEFFKIVMNIRTELSTLSMGHSIVMSIMRKFCKINQNN